MGLISRIFRRRKEEENLWTKCPECKTLLYVPDLKRNLKVCPKCDHHMSLSAVERVEQILDEEGAERLFEEVLPSDPLSFKDTKNYRDRLKKASKETGLSEAMVVVKGSVEGRKVILAVMDFGFRGGSMGSVVGERFFRSCETAVKERIPLIAVTCSGGARMQEGVISLMQMAKTVLGVGLLRDAGVPYITVLTNPTTGGVAASFAFLGDVIIAEPKALIGFAGPRVIEQTIKQKLPEGFQRSEFLLEKGMIDMVVHRRDLKRTLVNLLDLLFYAERYVR
ncbi:MAG: acetyl-CoA carboxylase, carboxyltransferase subunit beta [Aquificota bacterium]|nr:acetyl-CoA carboxylase, carboxyltransferase subunit beta [Aquificota bacterium]